MVNWGYILWAFFVLRSIQFGHLYNIEDKLPLFKYGPEASALFGFSVAQHRITTDDTVGADATWLVIGAPLADAMATQAIPITPKNPGGVYYCPVSTSTTDCIRVQMDSGGNTRNTGAGSASIKSNQWLGVSLESQGPGKFLVSCAHRYTRLLNLNTEDEQERMCGKCFLLNATSSGIVEIDPTSDALSMEFVSTLCGRYRDEMFTRKRRYGYIQAGASISVESDEYLLGAPGAWRWTGGLFDISMPTYVANRDPFELLLGPTGSPSISRTPTCFKSEQDGLKCDKLPLQRDSYMGFSVAASNAITTGSNETYYAAGAPRGNNTGAVVLFTKNVPASDKLLVDPNNIVVGTSLGSSFGYSIAFCDVNGDSLDDLVVGAPQYYEYNNRRKAGGAVYVYINDGAGLRGIVPHIMFGSMDSYFGHAVASLGDVDQDGYEDFAVGSPYEDGHGVVHIYRGTASGKVKLSQSIKGSSYDFVRSDTNRALVGFGASLSGEVDSDSNKYPDLLIGSFSDHVVLLRSRPIISVNMTFEVDRTEIDLEEMECDDEFACFKIKYCFEYRAKHDEYQGVIPLKYNMALDSIRQDKGKVPRTSMDTSDGFNAMQSKVELQAAGKKVCPGGFREIIFANNAEDKLSDIGVKFDFDLDLPEVKREVEGDEIFAMIKDPVLDADFEKEAFRIVKIKNTCGDDGCQSNLKVNAFMPKVVVVGDDSTLLLTIEVSNPGEEAHNAYVTATIPPNVDVPPPAANDSIKCYSATQSDVPLLRCDLGNPYKPGANNVIKIPLGVTRITPQIKKIQVKVEGFTSSENPDIPEISLAADVLIEQHLSLTTYATPEQVRYKEKPILGESAMNKTGDIGPAMTYSFDVKNEASTSAQGVGLDINLPISIFNGKWLLYLVAAEVTAGGGVLAGSCDNTYVNTLRLEPSLPIPGRTKREVEPEISFRNKNMLLGTIECGKHGLCAKVECELDTIPPKATISVMLQIRLWEMSFLEEKSIRTLDLVYVDTSAKVITFEENVRFKNAPVEGTVRTTVDHDFLKDDIVSTFPWWYILIGIILLLLIYILIIFLLIKCGFFKRKRYRPAAHQGHSVVEE